MFACAKALDLGSAEGKVRQYCQVILTGEIEAGRFVCWMRRRRSNRPGNSQASGPWEDGTLESEIGSVIDGTAFPPKGKTGCLIKNIAPVNLSGSGQRGL